ncbi:TatD family hydrolase [Neiella marina]|uniref:TatD family hydrolase n=1 Tax=Neiella holothuriorum TaxID=2870530 RepID=A0ABS7EKF4_9GAMM|nr:TatD family hydrolase [Neiella holothuriorum]MBW8192838.1 TatD family hydrolase [Neiella holothuriorum]
MIEQQGIQYSGLFDSHCHLDFDAFDDDRPAVLARCQQAGIERMLIPAVTASSFRPLLGMCHDMTSASLQLDCALGLHPYWIREHQLSDIALLQAELESNHSAQVAIGECGLDAFVAPELMSKQIRLLSEQFELALAFDLPVILHVRKAHNELQQLLKRYAGVRGVIHAFSGSVELAQSYIKLGMKLGIGGTITYARATKTRQAVSALPLHSLLLETDAPDMPLSGRQGQRNSPEHLPHVLESLVLLRKESADEIATQLWQNGIDLFGDARR